MRRLDAGKRGKRRGKSNTQAGDFPTLGAAAPAENPDGSTMVNPDTSDTQNP